MDIKRISLILSILILAACGLNKPPLQPVLETRVKTIELAKLEAYKILMIRQVNPAFIAMGTSGKVIDATMISQHARDYEKQAGPVNKMSLELFEKTLLKSLSRQGIKVGSSNKPYWDYYKPKSKQKRQQLDGLLHIQIKQLGFWSKGLVNPYRPSILVIAKLVDPVTRKVLYSDRFAMGIDITSLQVMALGYGKINILATENNSPSYQNFNALMHKPEQSRKALLKLVKTAAQHIAKSFHGDKRAITEAYAKTAAQVRMATSDDLIVAAHVANIRKGPSTRSKVLHKLKKGSVVTKMRRHGDWLYVLLKNKLYAWAHKSVFVRKQGDNAPQTQTIATNKLVTTAKFANIRKEPSAKSNVITTVKQGKVLTKMRKQGDWYHIRLQSGALAWAHQSVF